MPTVDSVKKLNKELSEKLKKLDIQEKAENIRHGDTIRRIDSSQKKVWKEFEELQYECKNLTGHEFPGEPTVMGRGICILCSYDDY